MKARRTFGWGMKAAIVVGMLISSGPLLAARATGQMREELKLQVMRELQELQAQQRRNVTEFETLQVEAEKASQALKEASKNQPGTLDNPQFSEARSKFYNVLSHKEHILYQINMTQKSITDRQELLNSGQTASR